VRDAHERVGDVALAAPERRQRDSRELELQSAQVAAAQADVMREVESAGAVLGQRGFDLSGAATAATRSQSTGWLVSITHPYRFRRAPVLA
jgi:hypothetical protein